jgi:hypothetical protein
MPTPDERSVAALYERWVKAGPPPLGVSLARWWDRRLIELRNAIGHRNDAAATEATGPETAVRDLTAALRERRHPIRQYPDERREAAERDMLAVFPPETEDASELTAEEARDLADDLGTQLYRAQDALAFVEECCVIAEREGCTITVADVRTWLKGAQCGRQLAADTLVVDPAAPPLHFVTWAGPPIPRFTYRPVTPEMERAATERAVQAAADSERSSAWFAETGGVIGDPAANNGEECPRTTADNPPTSSDTPDNLRRLRTQLAAERDKARRADEHPRPDLDHLRVTPHNGIAAGLEIALFLVDHHLREAGETTPQADGGPSVAECRDADRTWDVQKGGE